MRLILRKKIYKEKVIYFLIWRKKFYVRTQFENTINWYTISNRNLLEQVVFKEGIPEIEVAFETEFPEFE